MAFRKQTEKLDEYYARLSGGTAKKIKPENIEKVIKKLKAKEARLAEEIRDTVKDAKKARLERKLLIAGEHIRRAEWLLTEIQSEEP